MYYFICGLYVILLSSMAISELTLLWSLSLLFLLLKIRYFHLSENMQHLHTVLPCHFLSLSFTSLIYSVLYLVVTPVLVTFSLYLVVWWGPISSRSPGKSLRCILAGLVLLSVAWMLEAWPGWAVNPWLIFVLNFVKILFHCVCFCWKVYSHLDLLSLLDTWTCKSEAWRIFEIP